MSEYTGRKRMLNAYRGIENDRPAIAPEFWYYYPAKLLGVDMIEFEMEVPFHEALKTTFNKFGCEGWGIAFVEIPNREVQLTRKDRWVDENTLEVRLIQKTGIGEIETVKHYHRDNPSWIIERPVRNTVKDLEIWELIQFGGEPEKMDFDALTEIYNSVGEDYLLEAWLGVPFFDFYSDARKGDFETGIYEFTNPEFEPLLKRLQSKYIEMLVRTARAICENTPIESICIGCEWSCNSLIGPNLWRKWDKPVIKAVADEVHRHNKLLHIHFHGRCMETLEDFAEIGIDCVCPFERPPGGDVAGLEGLKEVEQKLRGRTTMNGNVHTVETLIRAKPEDVRKEVNEIMEAFRDNPRLIVGTGDQVGRETPEENLHAMIEQVIANSTADS